MADTRIPCRICAHQGKDKLIERKSLTGHLGAHRKHGWSKSKYIERWGNDDFDEVVKTSEQLEQLKQAREKRHARLSSEIDGETEALLTDPNVNLLTDEERTFYENFYNLVLQSVDRDEVQMPVIGSLAMDMVITQRLRAKQLRASNSDSPLAITKELEDAVEKAEKRIQASMKALNISREALSKNREQSKSTIAGFISGYLEEIERNSPEALEALMIDEKRALVRADPRIEKMILQYARDLEPEEESEDSDDAGTFLSFDDALKRAEITL